MHSSSEPSLHHHQSFGSKFQVAHRASTSSLHSCQSFAIREACSQIRFTAGSSASAVPLQLDLGRPLFLLPSGIHLSATFNHTFRLLIMQAETRVLWKADVYLATMWQSRHNSCFQPWFYTAPVKSEDISSISITSVQEMNLTKACKEEDCNEFFVWVNSRLTLHAQFFPCARCLRFDWQKFYTDNVGNSWEIR